LNEEYIIVLPSDILVILTFIALSLIWVITLFSHLQIKPWYGFFDYIYLYKVDLLKGAILFK